MEQASGGAYYNISLNDAIYEAKMHLKILNDSEDDFLEILAWNAVRNIGAISSYTTQVRRLKICEGRASLPSNMKRFLWFRIVWPADYVQNNTPSALNWNFMFADIAFLNQCGFDDNNEQANSLYNAYNVVRINNNQLQFSNRRNIFFDELDVAFIGYNVDDNGVFWINDGIKEAVVFRICNQYSVTHSQKYDNFQKATWRDMAMAQGNKARGDAAMDYFKENIDQIQQMYRAYSYDRVVSRKLSRF